ncbi:Trimethyllysine dioxygenase [Golovinomyces cichoracearum]|uniref:trimethyllysine dioxygenase n=1 Tax=Golovinomyces cichoracearum TaxID=62708 RepID=A0A420J9G7_9PEZI|nr:Trimethyllysine dioxygenase [Golovinomyces cichoracearum]
MIPFSRRFSRAHDALPLAFSHINATVSKRYSLLSKNATNSIKESLEAGTEWSPAHKIYRVESKQKRALPFRSSFRYNENGLCAYGPWGISLPLSANSKYPTRLPNLWLRDNCHCEKCIDPDTMQKAFDTFSLPEDIVPNEVWTEKEGLRVIYTQGPDDGNSHESFYPWSWIMKNIPKGLEQEQKLEPNPNSLILWDSNIETDLPSASYEEIMKSDHGVRDWTDKIRKYGFCFVENCPTSPEKTKELIERIAFIRQTHYDLSMKDTAYTNLALQPHTDTTYFTDTAGLQMLHLLSHEYGDGGISFLIDGFNAARRLKQENPAHYDILSSKLIHAHTVGNEGITIKPAKMFPVFNLLNSDFANGEPELYQIRWNNYDRGVVPLENEDHERVNMWYSAARRFNQILNLDSMRYKTKLKPGRPLIFDNWRVLHGRTAFTGKRRICGAYINHDDYISRWRNTNYSRKQILDDLF